jgi:hypothetical protein
MVRQIFEVVLHVVNDDEECRATLVLVDVATGKPEITREQAGIAKKWRPAG